MQNVEQQKIKIEETNWNIFSNIRHDAGDFYTTYHCAFCDPEGKKFYPKLILVGTHLACGHCVMNMTKAINESTLIDCRKGERH